MAGNNTVVITGPFILAAMLYNACVSLCLHQQSVLPASALVLAASLAAAAIIAAAYRRITGREGMMPRDAFAVGAVGGAIGAMAAATGIAWTTTTNTLLTETNTYLCCFEMFLLESLNSPIFRIPSIEYEYYSLIVPVYPSFWSFCVLSAVLFALLTAASMLICVGFHGYRAGELVGLKRIAFAIGGAALGGLLILTGALTTGYMYARAIRGEYMIFTVPVPAPNLSLAWLGFVVLGLSAILLGSVSISTREWTTRPFMAGAVGVLSIISGVVFLFSYIWHLVLFISFALMLTASILWIISFLSSKKAYS
ncbi:MAG: hypothetical protein QXX87_00875 [Candidatus Jordarchaeales archaeon]